MLRPTSLRPAVQIPQVASANPLLTRSSADEPGEHGSAKAKQGINTLVGVSLPQNLPIADRCPCPSSQSSLEGKEQTEGQAITAGEVCPEWAKMPRWTTGGCSATTLHPKMTSGTVIEVLTRDKCQSTRKRRGVSNHPSFLFGKRRERQMEEAIVGIICAAATVAWFVLIKWNMC